ncbi:MAG: hypothetical protein OEM97_06575 [Acidimicrobiia bacterium]|nr:hypothetical protein [Acidimicrobiia bacterium]
MTLAALNAYADPLRFARSVTAQFVTVARREGRAAVRTAVAELPDVAASAFLIAVEKAALASNPAVALADLLAELDDSGWAEQPADRLLESTRLGVASMGVTTRTVLEAMADHRRGLPEIIVPNLSVARGLGYLNLHTLTGDVVTADTLLVGGVARTETTVWTSPAIADAAIRAAVHGRRRVLAVHPVASLTEHDARRYRPHAGIVPAAI